MLYDHLLTFRDEVQYIWKARLSGPNFAFLLVRYTVPAAVIVQTWGAFWNSVFFCYSCC